MHPLLVGIAGGSGVGKTTLARGLVDAAPERYAVVRLDDYYKPDIPWVAGVRNWERPEALDFDTAYEDLQALSEGRTITVRGRMPQYDANQQKIGETPFEYVVEPRPIILFEGFLALYDARIRDVLDFSIFLSLPIEVSLARRALDTSKYSSEEYFRDILIPAHKEFVEPTQQYADVVIEVEHLSPPEVQTEVRTILDQRFSTTK